MSLFIHKREKFILELIKKHADKVEETVKLFYLAFNLYLDGKRKESKIQGRSLIPLLFF